jgi:hypothetical protein
VPAVSDTHVSEGNVSEDTVTGSVEFWSVVPVFASDGHPDGLVVESLGDVSVAAVVSEIPDVFGRELVSSLERSIGFMVRRLSLRFVSVPFVSLPLVLLPLGSPGPVLAVLVLASSTVLGGRELSTSSPELELKSTTWSVPASPDTPASAAEARGELSQCSPRPPTTHTSPQPLERTTIVVFYRKQRMQ